MPKTAKSPNPSKNLLIAQQGDWWLYLQPPINANPRSLLLRYNRPQSPGKKTWQLNWDGQSLAHNDAELLARQHPKTLAWTLQECLRLPALEPAHPAKRPVETLIGEIKPNWCLYHRSNHDRGSWHSLILRRTGPRLPKRTYWLGWNGSRLARNRDAKILLEYNPDVAVAVETACASYWH